MNISIQKQHRLPGISSQMRMYQNKAGVCGEDLTVADTYKQKTVKKSIKTYVLLKMLQSDVHSEIREEDNID